MASIKDKLAQASQNLKDRNQASGFKPSTPAYVPNKPSSSSSSSSSSNYKPSGSSSSGSSNSSLGNILGSIGGALGGGVNKATGNNSPSYAPGQLANNTASWNGSNWNDPSGVLINGKQVTHGQATGQNPLHVVNGQREGLIQGAVNSGDWQAYRDWSAKQTPMYFDKGSDGQNTYNKNYYASLLESSSRAMREAESKGDAFTASEWERNIRELVGKYNSAPGDAQYMVGINSNDAWANQWGVEQVGSDWFNSQWNNPEVRSQGYEGQRSWTQNPVFEDFNLLSDVLNLSNNYGSPEEQAIRQQINSDAMKNYYQGDIQAQMQADFEAQLKEQLEAQQKEYEKMLEDLKNQADYDKKEQNNAGSGTGGTSGGAPIGDINSIFTPGNSSNTGGYTENQLVTNDLFNNYLKNIYQGGF